MESALDLFSLLDIIDKLKHLKRTGWVRFGIPEPETVAGHMYRMAVLAMALAEKRKDLNVTRCTQMALIHDIGEAIIGDITPYCGISSDEKHKREKEAVEKIASYVPGSVGKNWTSLWFEYEEAVTPEAKAIKQLDKLDMIAQAATYEEKYGINLEEFFKSTVDSFTESPFIQWAEKIRQRRAEKQRN